MKHVLQATTEHVIMECVKSEVLRQLIPNLTLCAVRTCNGKLASPLSNVARMLYNIVK